MNSRFFSSTPAAARRANHPSIPNSQGVRRRGFGRFYLTGRDGGALGRADHLAVFRVDQQTGRLNIRRHYTPVGNPSQFVFLGLAKKG